MDRQKLGADTCLDWAKEAVEVRLPRIEGKLVGRTDEGANFMRLVISGLKQEFLFDGYEKFFKNLLPRSGNIVLGHCDA